MNELKIADLAKQVKSNEDTINKLNETINNQIKVIEKLKLSTPQPKVDDTTKLILDSIENLNNNMKSIKELTIPKQNINEKPEQSINDLKKENELLKHQIQNGLNTQQDKVEEKVVDEVLNG